MCRSRDAHLCTLHKYDKIFSPAYICVLAASAAGCGCFLCASVAAVLCKPPKCLLVFFCLDSVLPTTWFDSCAHHRGCGLVVCQLLPGPLRSVFFLHWRLQCFQILLKWLGRVIVCGARCFQTSASSVRLQCLFFRPLCHSQYHVQCFARCRPSASIYCIFSAAANLHVCCSVCDFANSFIQLYATILWPPWCPPIA